MRERIDSIYLTYQQARDEFNIPKTKLYNLRKARKVDYVDVPGLGYRFLRPSLERLMQEHTVHAEARTNGPAQPAPRKPTRKSSPPAGQTFRFLS